MFYNFNRWTRQKIYKATQGLQYQKNLIRLLLKIKKAMWMRLSNSWKFRICQTIQIIQFRIQTYLRKFTINQIFKINQTAKIQAIQIKHSILQTLQLLIYQTIKLDKINLNLTKHIKMRHNRKFIILIPLFLGIIILILMIKIKLILNLKIEIQMLYKMINKVWNLIICLRIV